MRILNTVDAVREAHELILAQGKEHIVIGEGVPDPKACFGTTRGLIEKFPNQVFDSPVSENGVTGICIGASLQGIKPIFIHMRQDFLAYAFDQILNNASKWHSMFGGNGGNVPIVVKAFTGRGWGAGHQHSQNLESLFAHIPGLKVLVPSSPRTAKGLLIAAVNDPNPCLILEDRWIHHLEGEVPERSYETKIGECEIAWHGRHAVAVTWGQLTAEAVRAAKILKEHGLELQVIDLLTLNMDAIYSVIGLLEARDVFIFQNAWRTGAFAKTVAYELSMAPMAKNVTAFTLEDCYPSSSPSITDDYYITHKDIVRIVSGGIVQVGTTAFEQHDIPDRNFVGPF